MYETLHHLLPHRPPVLLLEALEDAGRERARARAQLAAGSWGCEGGHPEPETLIECAAQTPAAFQGAAARAAGAAPARGLLVGVRGFRFPHPARCDVPLSITVTVRHRLGPLCLIEAELSQAGACVGRGQLKLFLEPGDGP